MANCRFKLKEMLNSLTSKEKAIAQYIIDHPAETVRLSIGELAETCSTSISTVVRLCKTAGYSGYKEFCRDLSIDVAQSPSVSSEEYGDILSGGSMESIMNAVCSNSVTAIENTMAVLDPAELEKAVSAISAAKRVDFYGIGTSGHVAMDAYNKFVRINKLSMSTSDPHQQVLNASQLAPGDVAVLISYSGDTKDILETADVVKQAGATLISLTRYSKNPLSKMADICLYSSSSEALVRSGAMGSRIGQLTIIDILYTAVASFDYNQIKSQLDKTRLAAAKKHTDFKMD